MLGVEDTKGNQRDTIAVFMTDIKWLQIVEQIILSVHNAAKETPRIRT